MDIREATESDRNGILNIHTLAFGEKEGPIITNLVDALFDDKTAAPILSLVAVVDGGLIGHILFTNTKITQTNESVSARILAPLAVLPQAQRKGVGRELINAGLKLLKNAGVELVFVLGHPGYYPRCGFVPAGVLGFEAPYPIPEEHSTAWMIQGLNGGAIDRVNGKVQCSAVLNQPQYWRE